MLTSVPDTENTTDLEKKQKRLQGNRESAKRSREKRIAEFSRLQKENASLKEDNDTLKARIAELKEIINGKNEIISRLLEQQASEAPAPAIFLPGFQQFQQNTPPHTQIDVGEGVGEEISCYFAL